MYGPRECRPVWCISCSASGNYWLLSRKLTQHKLQQAQPAASANCSKHHTRADRQPRANRQAKSHRRNEESTANGKAAEGQVTSPKFGRSAPPQRALAFLYHVHLSSFRTYLPRYLPSLRPAPPTHSGRAGGGGSSHRSARGRRRIQAKNWRRRPWARRRASGFPSDARSSSW